MAWWTYDAKGRATSSVGDGGASHWTFAFDGLDEIVKVTDPRGRTAIYERKLDLSEVRRLVPIDLDDVFLERARSRQLSSSPITGGSECWFGIFCEPPPMCAGPSEDHAL